MYLCILDIILYYKSATYQKPYIEIWSFLTKNKHAKKSKSKFKMLKIVKII